MPGLGEAPHRRRSGGRAGDGARLMWTGDKTPLVRAQGGLGAPGTVVASGSRVFGFSRGVGGTFFFFFLKSCGKLSSGSGPGWGHDPPKAPSSGAELRLPPRLILHHLWSCLQGEGRGQKSLFLRNCLKISVPLRRQQRLSPQDQILGLRPTLFLAVLLHSTQWFQCKKVT